MNESCWWQKIDQSKHRFISISKLGLQVHQIDSANWISELRTLSLFFSSTCVRRVCPRPKNGMAENDRKKTGSIDFLQRRTIRVLWPNVAAWISPYLKNADWAKPCSNMKATMGSQRDSNETRLFPTHLRHFSYILYINEWKNAFNWTCIWIERIESNAFKMGG